MHSPQDLLALSNGVFGGTHVSSAVGNTGDIITGMFGLVKVHSPSIFNTGTVCNIENLTGVPLVAGDYGGRFDFIQLTSGDVTAYKLPKV